MEKGTEGAGTARWPGLQSRRQSRALSSGLGAEPGTGPNICPRGNFGRLAGSSVTPEGGWPEVGKSRCPGPSAGHAAGLFFAWSRESFVQSLLLLLFFFCNWSCLLPSHLSHHGDSSSLSRQNGRSLVGSAWTVASPPHLSAAPGHPVPRASAGERQAGGGAGRDVAGIASCFVRGLPRTQTAWLRIKAGRRLSKHIISPNSPARGGAPHPCLV